MLRRVVTFALLAALWPATAAAQDPSCLTADLPPITKPAHPLRFGITPGMAGSAGAAQETARPLDQDKALTALRDLRPPNRDLVLRLNRLFWSDGTAGIRRFADDVDRYAKLGLRSEVQLRYHPPEGMEGNIPAWEQFVREAVRTLGPKRSVAGFTMTNEANLPVSPNTSDGAYDGVVDALVRGVVVAREELDRLKRPGLDLGFNVMWRWSPESDRKFWEEIGAKATPAFRSALTNVGLQVYPGLVWPPVSRPGVSAGDEVIEALTLVRRCYMPKAGLGEQTKLWVSENGYATNLGHDEAGQLTALDSTVRAVHAYSGELGITDYRYFNLRDNVSNGTDLFSAVGLLRDDHSRKPSFLAYRGLVAQLGTAPPPAPKAKPKAKKRRCKKGAKPRRRRAGPCARGRTGRRAKPAAARSAR
jgi:hypothetical protein